MNIGKNLVKTPTTSKKKKLFHVSKADVHSAQPSGSGIKKQRRESMAVAPREGGVSPRGLKLLGVGLDIR